MLEGPLCENKKLKQTIIMKIFNSFLMIIESIPVMISNIGGISVLSINAYFAGHMKDVSSLAAIGICNSWIFFIAIAPLICFNLGFFSLASQVNGTGIKDDLKVICQRGFIFNIILFLISAFFLLLSPVILPLLGVQEHLIDIAVGYLYAYIPVVFFEIFVDMLKNLLCAQKIFHIHPISAAIVIVVHYFQSYFFIKLEWGLISLALSKMLTNIYLIFIISAYMKYKNINGFLIESFDKRAKENLWEYAKNVITSGMSGYVEWMAFEITTIMASNFDDVVLSSHTAFIYTFAIYYCFFTGVGVLYSSNLGNALGRKDLEQTQELKDNFKYLISLVLLLAFVSLKISFPWAIRIITDKEDVICYIVNLSFLPYTLGIFDFYQGNLAPILRVIGQQNYGAKMFLFVYYFIGIPIGLIFGVYLKWTLFGWLGGMYISQIIFCFFAHRKFNDCKAKELIIEIEKEIELQVKN